MTRRITRTRALSLAVLVLLLVINALVWPPNRLVSSAATATRHAMSPGLDVPEQLAAKLHRACADCHSAATAWPWYATVFPFNSLLASHVRRGREEFTLPSWTGTTASGRLAWMNLGASCYDVRHGIMPPSSYRMVHPESRWSTAEMDALCAWTERLRDSLKAVR